jgi:outer membrane receptor protein involved in Fe transport
LTEALEIFAQQTGLQVLYSSELTAGLRSQEVVAGQPLQATLDQLLRGTNLEVEFLNDRTIILTASKKSRIPGNSGDTGDLLSAQNKPTQKYQDSAQDLYLSSVSEKTQGAPGKSHVSETDKQEHSTKHTANGLEEIVVTGTFIRGVAPESSPLTVYSRQDIERTGVATVDQFVKLIPQNFSLVGSDTAFTPGSTQAGANLTRGTAVDLRGLGPGSTLVLLNGHRLASAGTDGSFVDVSTIPLSAVERVEVLADGASSLYGSDAVSGVVNFILRKDFAGAETSVRYGDTTRGGADELTISQLVGGASESGNAMLVYEHNQKDGLRADQRDFIPSQGGIFQIVPEQRRDSAIFSANYELMPGSRIFGDASYSKRTFVHDTTIGGALQAVEGDSLAYTGVLGLRFQPGLKWGGEATLNYSTTRDQSTADFPDFDFIFSAETKSQLISLDLRGDGPLFALPGGDAQASIGASARREQFDDFTFGAGTGLKRRVASAFAEFLVPIVGPANALSIVQRLELSISARYDNYEEVGSSTNPKVGLLWAPAQGLHIRSSYATSFRAPLLSQLSTAIRPFSFNVFHIPDASAADGYTDTLVNSSPGNPNLRPEKSKSWTVGFDLKPPSIHGFNLSASYFNIDYTDRLSSPPLTGLIFSLYDQFETLSPFIDRNPDSNSIREIYLNNEVGDLSGVGAGGVEALFDQRIQNFAEMKTSGLDLTTSYYWSTGPNHFAATFSGAYLRNLNYQALPTTATIKLAGNVYNPPHRKLRSDFSWNRSAFSTTVALNAIDHYRNGLVSPSENVSRWMTLDFHIMYQGNDSSDFALLQGTKVSLSILNLADKDPPYIRSDNPDANFGYDATNSSPLGRFISMYVSKHW